MQKNNFLVTYEGREKEYCIMIQAYDLPHLITEAHKPDYKRNVNDKIIKVHKYKK